MDFLSPASVQEHHYRERMAICASTTSIQYNIPDLSEFWPANNLQSPSSDRGASDSQHTQTPNRPFDYFANDNNPVFQYEASIPCTGAQMQHIWPPMANEHNEKPRSTKRKEQNRIAQRAFRERKEKHSKNLEKQVVALTEELQLLRLAYKKLRQSHTTGNHPEDDELRDEVEANPEPLVSHVDDGDDILCFDMT